MLIRDAGINFQILRPIIIAMPIHNSTTWPLHLKPYGGWRQAPVYRYQKRIVKVASHLSVILASAALQRSLPQWKKQHLQILLFPCSKNLFFLPPNRTLLSTRSKPLSFCHAPLKSPATLLPLKKPISYTNVVSTSDSPCRSHATFTTSAAHRAMWDGSAR